MSKHALAALAILFAIALPRAASAADLTLVMELTSSFWFVATLEDPDHKPADPLVRCARALPKAADVAELALPHPDRRNEIGRVRVGDATPSEAIDRFIVGALDSQSVVQCFRKSAPARPLPVKVTRKVATGAKMDSSLPAFAPGIDWYAFRHPFGEALLDLLGQPTGCTIEEGGVKEAKCYSRGIEQPPGRLRLDVGNSPGVKRMTVTFAKKQTVSMQVVPCGFYATGSLKYVVAGAASQVISLASQQPECDARLDRLAGVAVTGGAPIDARALPRSLLDGARAVVLSNIPASLALGETTFTLRGDTQNGSGANGDELGTAVLRVIEPLTAGSAPKVRITYDLPKSQLAPYYFPARTNDDTAVVAPAQANDIIWNTVSVALKPPLPSVSARPSTGWPSTPWSADDERRTLARSTSKLQWRIRRGDQADVEWKACRTSMPFTPSCDLPDGPGNLSFAVHNKAVGNVDATVDLVEVTEATIADPAAAKTAAEAKEAGTKARASRAAADKALYIAKRAAPAAAAAARAAADTLDEQADLDEQEAERAKLASEAADAAQRRSMERVILSTTVRLASAVREESVLLPARDRIYVDCKGARKIAADTETRAVDDEDVVSGQCALVYLPVPVGKPGPHHTLSVHEVAKSKLGRDKLAACRPKTGECEKQARKEAWLALMDTWITARDPDKEYQRLNAFFGRQLLIVTVKRDGTEIASEPWEFSPERPDWMVLPHNTDNARGNVYEIEIRPAARPTQSVLYASATVDNGHAVPDNPRTDLRFSAKLRSRGIFGFPDCVRMYVTVPVQLIGFRFPAATPELRNSSDSTAFQYMTPRTGLLGVIEPWDYDSGQNPWPLNPTLAGGLLALELTKPHVALSTLLGVQFKTPLIDTSSTSSQLGTSATLGLFWEHGIQENENRFLVTVGANILSLFAGK